MDRAYRFILRHKWLIADVAVLVIIGWLLLSYFEPEFLFSKTTTTGGDTASHYYTAQYLKDYILPKGRVTGWLQGNYAGFPFFQLYFPLPFVLMVFLSYVIPLQIAFKLLSVTGIFLLPLCTYLMFRLLRYSFPVPIITAIFTLPFLFMEANRFWGGNIPSTLAGEFSFSIALALTILYLGTIYRCIENNKFVISNSILLFLISLSHGCTLILAVFAPLFLLMTTNNFLSKLKYYLKVNTLGFLLLGFWLIPLLLNSDYTTYYNFRFKIDSISQFIPLIIIPFVFFAVANLFLLLIYKKKSYPVTSPPVYHNQAGSTKTVLQQSTASVYVASTTDTSKQELCDNEWHKILYLIFTILVSLVFYFTAYSLNVIDIRFLPFIQLFLLFTGAVGFCRILSHLRFQWLVPFILILGTVLWVNYNVTYIKGWIRWNYTGFEGKKSWRNYRKINDYLAGTLSDPRVVYEHADDNNKFGSLRAFESLPLFSGRSTLEGLYMQSSISAPFIFYIQSEISDVSSAPLPEYNCTSVNIRDAITHLKMFNVSNIIARSKNTKTEIGHYNEIILKKKYGKYNIYELSTNQDSYVTPLKYKPVQFSRENWRRVSYNWFKNNNANDIHLVFTDNPGKKGQERFEISQNKDLNELQRIPIQPSGSINAEISEEEILIDMDAGYMGKPLLIKVSYHPNWKVEGADKIYLASPCFMLIYPDSTKVRLYYGSTTANHAGNVLTIIGIIVLFLNIPIIRRRYLTNNIAESLHTRLLNYTVYANTVNGLGRLSNLVSRNSKRTLWMTLTVVAISVFLLILFIEKDDANTLNRKGMEHYHNKEYRDAIAVFDSIANRFPDAADADDAGFFKAICYSEEGDYVESVKEFQRLIKLYPESKWVPESYYRIGINEMKSGNLYEAIRVFADLILEYKRSVWAERAREQLRKNDFK